MTISLWTTNTRLNIALLCVYIGYVGLLTLFTYTCFLNEDHSWKLWIFQSVPLLILAPGLLQGRYRSHSWLCFAILAYFIAYVAEVGSPIGDVYDWIGLVCSISVFCGAMMASRGLQRQ